MRRWTLGGVLAWAVLGCTPTRTVTTHRPPDVPVPLPVATPSPTAQPVRIAAGLPYVEALTGGAQADDVLPLIVVLHGSSATPEGILGVYTSVPMRARVVALRGPLPDGSGFSWFSLDADLAAGIQSAADAVAPALAEVARQRPTCGLPVVSGFSQGAMVAYALAAQSPPVVRAAAPIAGMLPATWPPFHRPVGGLLPEVHGFHGEQDRRVPVGDAWRTITWLREAGFTAQLITEPGSGHEVTPTIRAGVLTFLAKVARCGRAVGAR